MAGRITIRRVGSVLPTVCLLSFLVVSLTVVWLSGQGFPEWVLRYVEEKAAEQGVYLKLGAVKLAPARGLAIKVEGAQLFARAGEKEPLARVRHVAVGVSAAHLLVGEVRPSFFNLLGGEVRVPVAGEEGKALEVSDLELSALSDRDGMIRVTSGKLNLQDIPVVVRGSLNPELRQREPKQTSGQKMELATLLEGQAELVDRIYTVIEQQHWSGQDMPSLDVRIDFQEEFRVAVRASVPRYDVGQFHFRQAAADFVYNKKILTINSLRFRTIDPEASASLQGAYDIAGRRLSFNMESNAALLRMARHAGNEAVRAYLSKFHHSDEHLPHVRSTGDIEFEENFSLKTARVRGFLEQEQLMVGSSKVDELELSFFYDNGNFNIDKLELRLPDGVLQASASAQDGEGQAQVAADLPVQRVLTLIAELAEQEVELPEGLVLGDRVNLQLHARLTAPAFKPGQTDWQDFVPSFRLVGAKLHSDLLEYEGNRLENAEVAVKLSGIDQTRDYQLRGVQEMQLQLQASSASTVGEDGKGMKFGKVKADITGHQVSFREDGMPQGIAEVKLTADAEELALSAREKGEEVGSEDGAKNLHARVEVSDVKIEGEGTDVSIGEGSADLTAQEARMAGWETGTVEAKIDDMKDIMPLGESKKFFAAVKLQTNVRDIRRGEVYMGNLQMIGSLQEYTHGIVEVQWQHGEDAGTTLVSAEPDWTNPEEVLLRNIHVEVQPKAVGVLMELTGTESTELEIPEKVEAQGDCKFDAGMRLMGAQWKLTASQLVRTPHKQKVFEGDRVEIAVETGGEMHRSRDGSDLLYTMNVLARHETGDFNGVISGSTEGTLRVTGTNTIRADVVDRLIDNDDAHSIIRDFRFTDKTKTNITEIKVDVDLRDGIAVDSYCWVELENAGYMLSVLEDTADGGERVRQDVGKNLHSSVTRATCGVAAHVIMDRKRKDGTPEPDECVITITKPTLVYDNTDWLHRSGIKNGTRETTLSGEAVIIDVEHSFVELRNVKGSVYPAYSFGMFFADMYGILEDVIVAKPVMVETPMCVFPIYDDCIRPMSGTIRVMSEEDVDFHFLGTTIPLSDFSGFVHLTDDYVQLDRMNAVSWEGVLNASLKIGISGKRTSLDGYVKAQCMNLQKIAAAYDSKQVPALCSGEIRFRAPDLGVKQLTGYGRVDIENGDLMQLNLFRPVSAFISDLPGHFTRLESEVRAGTGKEKQPGFFMKVLTTLFKGLGKIVGKTGNRIGRTASDIPGMNHLIAYDLQEAHANFRINNGFIFTRDMKAKGSNLNVRLNADLNLETLEIRGNLWPRISSLPTIMLSPLTMLSDFMVDIILYGTMENLQWKIALDKRIKQESAGKGEERTPHSPTGERKRWRNARDGGR